jgi:RNA polymerase sigma-70 factor, ECF subfamily
MDSEDRVQREEMLRRAVLAGDENAWRTLYQETFEDLCSYVRWRCGGQPDWADEVIQETWLTAVRRIRRFRPEAGSFLAWLRGIAANVLRNQIRSRIRLSKHQQPRPSEVDQPAAAESQVDENEQLRRIAATLDALPERQEAVLRAKYLESRSVAEIAAMWSETPKAVESLLSRARQAFREAYRGEGDEHANA